MDLFLVDQFNAAMVVSCCSSGSAQCCGKYLQLQHSADVAM